MTNMRIRSVVAAFASVALLFAATPAASATTLGANVITQSNGVHWTGWAVDATRTWTYSWRIRLYSGSHSLLEEHINEGLSGSTYYSTPSYISPYPVGPYCVVFYLYHSSTVGNNRFGTASDGTC
jgi:hypothetical protein